MKQISLIYCFFLLGFTAFPGCKKYLAGKPDQSLAEPSTLEDLQLMLDAYSLMNSGYSAMGELSADNYYLTDDSWGSSNSNEQHYYIWEKYDDNVGDYSGTNKVITTANLILESLESISADTKRERVSANNIKGSALFFRAFAYWQLAQHFCKVYTKESAKTDPGLPLRTTSRVIGKFPRNTIQETYRRITGDLLNAIPLLPDIANTKYHASKAAAYGLLSRTYLSMQEYKLAGTYADSSLQLCGDLMNYNSDQEIARSSKTVTFKQWNKEVIFDAISKSTRALARTRAIVDSSLYSAYDDNDLRKSLFYQANTKQTGYYFKGNYTGSSSTAMFYGLATDEMLLTRAECAARENNVRQAEDDLNTLLQTRWVKGTYIPVENTNKETLLVKILNERRKELVFRGLRWMDLRRLNLEPKFQTTIKRIISGKQYELLPQDIRYVFLFPYQSVEISGIEQNP